MARMTKLPAAVEAAIPTIRDEWLGIGLATGPADRIAAQKGVELAYATAGKQPPALTIWLRSPREGAIGAAMLSALPRQVGDQVWAQVGDQVGAQVRDQVWDQVGAQVRAQVGAQVRAQVRAQVGAQVGDQVRAQVWAQVGAQVGDQVRDQVRDQVGAQVRAQVGDQVRDQVGDQVGDQVRAQVWAQVGAQVGDQVGDQVRAQVRAQVGAQVWRACYGQHDASWLAFYATFRMAGLDVCDRLAGLSIVARSSGWWWAFDNAVILTERPTQLHRDTEGRLHCEDGLALFYPDGFGIWAWHGVRVPQQVIESPETLTAHDITTERNAEVRRVMLERFGADRYIKAINATVLDRSDYGTLYRAELEDDEPLVMVEVINSTAEPDGSYKPYMLRVPPHIERAREAVAWTFGMEESTYAPLIQT